MGRDRRIDRVERKDRGSGAVARCRPALSTRCGHRSGRPCGCSRRSDGSRHAPIRRFEPARLRRLVSRGVARCWRRRRARTRARRRVHRLTGSGVSRLPGIARRQPRVSRGGAIHCADRLKLLRRRARRRLASAHRPGAHAGLRLLGQTSRDHAHALRRAASEGRNLRSVARRDRFPSRHRARSSGGACARARQWPERHGVDRPFGRGSASARISRSGR